jgi:hypothetical protein
VDDQGLIPGRGNIFLFSITSISGAHPSYQLDTESSFPEDKQQGYEAEVKNGGVIPPLPHISS